MRDEAASQHVLEATIVVCLMFGAIASMTAFTQAPPPSPFIERMMTTKASDILHIWKDTPRPITGPCDPPTELDALVGSTWNDGDTRWQSHVKKLLGDGVDVDLVLDNIHGILPVQGSGRVVGNSASVHWAPAQTYAYPLTSVSDVTGTEALQVDVAGIRDGRLVRSQGEAIRYEVAYSTASSEQKRGRWGLTALGSSPGEGAGFLQWEYATNIELVRELSPLQTATEGQLAFASDLAIHSTLGLDGSSPVIPQGAQVEALFPLGWHSPSWLADSLGPWQDISPGPIAGHPPILRAVATEPTTSRTLSFEAYAAQDPSHPLDIITARLSHGSLAESSLVVMYPVPDTDRSTPRLVAPTTPYPLRLGEPAIFGLAFANGGENVTVHRVDITIPGGYDLDHNDALGAPLFVSVDNAKSFPADGWDVIDAWHLQWTDETGIEVEAARANQWYAHVEITGDEAHVTSVEPASSDGPSASLSFANGFEVTSRSWGNAPGIVSVRVPPADPLDEVGEGYPWSAAQAAVGASEPYTVTSTNKSWHRANTSSYRITAAGSDLTRLDNAVAEASWHVDKRIVRVGTNVEVQGDFTALSTELGRIGAAPRLGVDLYDPTTLACRPTASWEVDASALPTSEASAVLVWDGGSGTPGVFVGASDGFVYRLDATGAISWAYDTQGSPRLLVPVSRAGAHHLLVGTSASLVARVSMGGEEEWSTTGVDLEPIMGLAYDAGRDLVFVLWADGSVKSYAWDGTPVASLEIGDPASQLIVSDAHLYVLTPTGILQLDPASLVQTDDWAGVPKHMILTGQDVLAAEPARAVRLDATTMEMLEWRDFDAEQLHFAGGDATGDAVDDLVVADGLLHVIVIDGASFEQAYEVDLTGLAQAPGSDPLGQALESGGRFEVGEDGESVVVCEPAHSPATYGAALLCDGDAPAPAVHLMHAANGRLSVSYTSTKGTFLEQRDATGGSVWVLQGSDTRATAMGSGTWTLGSDVLGVGTGSGVLRIISNEGDTLLTSDAAARVGRFSFLAHIPRGGFFGTHLLVARLTWEAGGVQQEARLMDWFEAVDPAGRPVDHPTYYAALTVAPREGVQWP